MATEELRLPVIAPECCTFHGRQPDWKHGRQDASHFFDPKYPYLHLPYGGGDYGEDYCSVRVFFNRRQYPELKGRRIKAAWLEHDQQFIWVWVVEVTTPATPGPKAE